MERTQASTFDEPLFEEIQQTIAAQLGNDTPDLEDHIWGEDVKSEAEKNLVHAQFCYEFMNLPFYPLYVQSLLKMVEREHKAFEKAETDPGDRLRIKWQLAQKIVTDIVGHIDAGSNYYIESLKEVAVAEEENGLPQTSL